MNLKHFNFIFLLSVILGFAACKSTQNATLSTSNTAVQIPTQQDTKPFVKSVRSQYLLKDSSSIEVFVKIQFENLPELNSVEELNKIFKPNWVINPDFGIKEKLESGSIYISEENTVIDEGEYIINFQVPRLRDRSQAIVQLLLLDMANSRKFTNDFFINFSGKRVSERFGLFSKGSKIPLFKDYLSAGQAFEIRAVDNQVYNLYLKKLDIDIEPALSPMSTSSRNELNGLSYANVRKIKTGEAIVVNEPGNYAISTDSVFIENSKGFLVVDEFFPRLVDVDEIKLPLFYMSTNTEINSLKDTLYSSKDALDLYFLKLASGNRTQAKQLVRSYFRRVSKVNELFTSYKEGWKTDQGMVYMIMGAPSEVRRNGKKEVWLYQQGQSLSPIYFTFYRKPNELTSENYELVRYPEYGAYWYPYVEAWRTGSVLE